VDTREQGSKRRSKDGAFTMKNYMTFLRYKAHVLTDVLSPYNKLIFSYDSEQMGQDDRPVQEDTSSNRYKGYY